MTFVVCSSLLKSGPVMALQAYTMPNSPIMLCLLILKSCGMLTGDAVFCLCWGAVLGWANPYQPGAPGKQHWQQRGLPAGLPGQLCITRCLSKPSPLPVQTLMCDMQVFMLLPYRHDKHHQTHANYQRVSLGAWTVLSSIMMKPMHSSSAEVLGRL